MTERPRRKPVRTPADHLHITLSPEDGARARRRAQYVGLSLGDYVTRLVRDDKPDPMPGSFGRLGACIVEAIAVLESEDSDAVRKAIELLREAQQHGAAIALQWVPAYDQAYSNETPWAAPDRPETRAR